jgi:hypothetical protein
MKSKLHIPKKFYVAGIPVKVEEINGLSKEKNCLSMADFANQKILLDPYSTAPETLEQAFIYQTLCFSLYVMGEHELRENTKLIDTLAHLVHQSLTMQEG